MVGRDEHRDEDERRGSDSVDHSDETKNVIGFGLAGGWRIADCQAEL